MFKAIEKCRVCGCTDLVDVVDLGKQALTGVFPASIEQNPPASPIELISCANPECSLVQLRHSVDPTLMFGDTYGYASSANASMVNHLKAIKEDILSRIVLNPGDIVLDIGSNDGTFLNFFAGQNLNLVGMDPSAAKYKHLYNSEIKVVFDYFSDEFFIQKFSSTKAKLITSFACVYDIEDLTSFVKKIKNILREDGVWVFEAAYLPDVLEKLAYDGLCHEHLTLLSIKNIQFIVQKVGLKIINIEFTPTNGGSFRVIVGHKSSTCYPVDVNLENLLKEEEDRVKRSLPSFSERVFKHRADLVNILTKIKEDGKTIFGLGASTKLNVVLQFCNITSDLLPALGEVTTSKVGRYTPGSLIPIISETEILSLKPDFLLVGPYHFRQFFLNNETFLNYIKNGGTLLFPLPEIGFFPKSNYEKFIQR